LRKIKMTFSKAFQLAKLIAIADGREVAVSKFVRSDEWKVWEGQIWPTPDLVVMPKGDVRVQTMVGRRALAQTS
jgi:hypothetical protein